jgi:hypothetical protein
MARYTYVPKQSGCICITDPWRQVIAWIDCAQGGAQEAFAELCADMERAGWRLEPRTFDYRYIRRAHVRWEVAIALCPAERARAGVGSGAKG